VVFDVVVFEITEVFEIVVEFSDRNLELLIGFYFLFSTKFPSALGPHTRTTYV